MDQFTKILLVVLIKLSFITGFLFLVFYSMTLPSTGSLGEFVLGYDFEQSYSVPIEQCHLSRDGGSNTTNNIECSGLYRQPFVSENGTCKYGELICPFYFLGESRVHILIGLSTHAWCEYDECRYPGVSHTKTNFGLWPFNGRTNNVFRVVSLACDNKTVEETNQCINKFLFEPRQLEIQIQCWGMDCYGWNQIPWYFSSEMRVTLLVIASICFVFFSWFFIALLSDKDHHCCRSRHGNDTPISREQYQSMS